MTSHKKISSALSKQYAPSIGCREQPLKLKASMVGMTVEFLHPLETLQNEY